MLCERCWSDASARTRVNGHDRMENYYDLLKEREANPCTPAQQQGISEPATTYLTQRPEGR